MICMLSRSVFELQDELGRTLTASDTDYFLKRYLQLLPTFSDVFFVTYHDIFSSCREIRELKAKDFLKFVDRYTKMAACLFNVDQRVSKAPRKPDICKRIKVDLHSYMENK